MLRLPHSVSHFVKLGKGLDISPAKRAAYCSELAALSAADFCAPELMTLEPIDATVDPTIAVTGSGMFKLLHIIFKRLAVQVHNHLSVFGGDLWAMNQINNHQNKIIVSRSPNN